MAKELRTFVLVSEGKILSPTLVTIREYAGWMEKYFDKYTCQLELYIPAKKSGGTVSEWHPGTKIGRFFDMQEFKKSELQSWYLPNDCKGFKQLIKHGFVTGNDSKSGLLRMYTLSQLDLYIKKAIDDSFEISGKFLPPIQITITKEEAERLVKPRIAAKRKLF